MCPDFCYITPTYILNCIWIILFKQFLLKQLLKEKKMHIWALLYPKKNLIFTSIKNNIFFTFFFTVLKASPKFGLDNLNQILTFTMLKHIVICQWWQWLVGYGIHPSNYNTKFNFFYLIFYKMNFNLVIYFFYFLIKCLMFNFSRLMY